MSLSRQTLRHCGGSHGIQYLQVVARRSLSSTPVLKNEPQDAAPPAEPLPRWVQTPPRMKAPFSLNVPKDPKRQIWEVNNDPEKLDHMYERLLGRDVTRSMPEELKFLAVTHKSFDHGRRGFNTKLAFYGRQILALEATRLIMASPSKADGTKADFFDREPFHHPALANVDKLGHQVPRDMLSPEKISKVAMDVGLHEVLRWKPRMPENLAYSGIPVVLTSTMYAIVGAVSLHSGAEVASKIVRERILKRMAD